GEAPGLLAHFFLFLLHGYWGRGGDVKLPRGPESQHRRPRHGAGDDPAPEQGLLHPCPLHDRQLPQISPSFTKMGWRLYPRVLGLLLVHLRISASSAWTIYRSGAAPM